MLRLSSARQQLTAALAAVMCGAVPVLAQRATASDSRYRWSTVTYLSGDLVYLDAGTVAGLREKSAVDVMRRDSVVAVLEVQFVSSTRAAARTTRGSGVVVGDSVRFIPAKDAVAGSVATSATAGATSGAAGDATTVVRKRSGARSISGRAGFRYMSIEAGNGPDGKLTQPAVDLRLEGHRVDGTPFGIVVDARAHRQRDANGQVEGSTRVYQSLVEYQRIGAFPMRVTAGRQVSSVLSPLGFFDGLTVDVDQLHWHVGVLSGTQPDYVSFKPSGAIRESGAWLQWHNAPSTNAHVQATLGGVGSYASTGINREFALLATNVVTRTVSLYATQEIDINRGWRKTAEAGHALTPTSTFATMRVSLPSGFSLNGGYDSRRSVRLYRDFITPDVVFDDALRRGYWAGAGYSAPHIYASADSRVSDGATVGRNQSNTAMLSVSRLTKLALGLRARGTTYRGPTVTGTVASASLEADPWGRVRVEATVGRREDQHAQTGLVPARTSWFGFDADAGIGRSWYAMISSYREVGAGDRLLQQYVSLSWRF